MFIGHYAIAFGAKRFAPQVSLGALFLACQLADLIWPNLVLAGIEQVVIEPGATAMTPLSFLHYPYSHSLVALIVWGALFAVSYRLVTLSSLAAAVTIVATVVSHWLLDVVTHRPDMPVLANDSVRLGLSLWNYPALAIPIELALFGAGVWLYARATTPVDRLGRIGLWALVGFLLVVFAANLLGPPPPSVVALAWSAQAMWLLVAVGYWIDRHRKPAVG
jgi:membrane-bound metal-dependent hydrolase YbcI (DUF457 family)